ncbi:ABC transporter substrate-binding protein [Paenibacillus daejeonensis]|uniref:ABC transporter substrate-binding protein n=1 Tax=Paenibacillus daejeonensis TaxID=135193 RepID=UPI0003765AB5|nr:sugar ABC transporter substrate-binding protein [Paenibacillus daejeonensis]
MKNKAKVVMMMSLSAVLLSACTLSNSGSGSAPGGSGDGETVRITLGLPGGYDVTNKEIIDGFIAAHPNIEVDIQEAPWGDFTNRIATQIAGNTMPDLWFQENAVILGYGQRGVAEDLAPYIERDLTTDDYIDTLFAAQTPEGQVWGVPHGANPIALAYNKTIFEEGGVALPTDEWTFENLIEAAKQLTQTDANGNTEVFGFIGSSSITQGWFPWIKQAGGMVLDETLTESRFDDPNTIAGLQQLRDGIADGYFMDGDSITAYGGELPAFGSGKSAMFFLQYSTQVTMNNDFPDTDWDVVKIPRSVDGERYVPTVSNSWLISSRASQEAKDASWEFLKYYLGDEAQAILAESGSALPVKQSALALLEDSQTKPANKLAFTDGIAEGGVTLDENASWNEWRIAVQQIVNEIVKGNVTPEAGALDIHKRVQDILDSQS